MAAAARVRADVDHEEARMKLPLPARKARRPYQRHGLTAMKSRRLRIKDLALRPPRAMTLIERIETGPSGPVRGQWSGSARLRLTPKQRRFAEALSRDPN